MSPLAYISSKRQNLVLALRDGWIDFDRLLYEVNFQLASLIHLSAMKANKI